MAHFKEIMESQLWNLSASSLQATILVVTDHLLELRKEMCSPFPHPSSTSSWVVNGERSVCLGGELVLLPTLLMLGKETHTQN